ncbi:MAG: hypothetical protein A2915_01900 [Candidatus Yanofskybacteria bacterium RIFCSPLOWO2_01_FULL_41_34]|uniref:Ada DNA repair metal-binding domain-containing protein n=1 Tax=Candidatus Yanofskybacteria bacterium RIFCSPHIGHO2_01_FULL_41_26 TaxID=1802661 RepID=A0A1F8EEJ3_9BACT|nr:MAG: hypothetical protein A2649_00400 [Candidatus Yanofskybacteria bacterium RIFCSPHIGHO2_01_FULL_41_26]OGN22987.1 MAG: hypothetical protein A2915_01900 [Candidatus Yanofskybacteria bacterium RIFCSPLOWO2_01_FULL_41_34]
MNILAKIISKVKKHQKDIFLGFCILLISIIGFNIGRINALNKTPAQTTEKANIYQNTATIPVPNSPKQTPVQPQDLRVVASKASSSKKYHYSWCSSWKRINIKNQIWFNTEQEAKNAGYTLAGNCTN